MEKKKSRNAKQVRDRQGVPGGRHVGKDVHVTTDLHLEIFDGLPATFPVFQHEAVLGRY